MEVQIAALHIHFLNSRALVSRTNTDPNAESDPTPSPDSVMSLRRRSQHQSRRCSEEVS